jgi:hypothetical protein
VGLFSAGEKRVFEHTDRVHPIYFEFPSETVDDVTITLPLGWQVGTLPAAQNQDVKVVDVLLLTSAPTPLQRCFSVGGDSFLFLSLPSSC